MMWRINYRRPESLPPHQRDFPPRGLPDGREESRQADGSHQLVLMVALYVLAMVGGLVLLSNLTTPTNDIATAENTAAR
jgi:hypothetical protein